jgi:hypothetical protein
MKNLKYIIIFLIFSLSTQAFSMSLFRAFRDRNDSPPTQPAPAPTPSPSPSPTPTEPDPIPTPPRTGEPSDFNIFNEVAFPVGDEVDQYYSNYQELLPNRSDESLHAVDVCEVELEEQNSFADRIAYYVHKHTQKTKTHLAQLAPYYDVPSDLSRHAQVSLKSHRLCPVTRSSLRSTIGSSRVPNSSVISLLNEFSQEHNNLRNRSSDGNVQAEIELNQLWTRFMSCLSYTESLTSADNSSSRSVANKYAPSNYRKPAGVKFYEDPYQDQASKLNIGLFQFTPNARGNVNACLRHWNEMNGSCQVSTRSSQSELIRVFGSGYQTFNAFCGVNKILQTFSIQVNTTSSRSTHPQNTSGGRKPASQRCVTPFFYSGWAYNHFGPLMNSTGRNMEKLIRCVMR